MGKSSDSYRLYVVPANGGRVRALEGDEVVFSTEPSWSPDGRRIAYTTADGKIRTVAAAGGASTTLAALREAGILDLAWSPDGMSIAFVVTAVHPEDE
jgi:Tol biopolymer transport system component